MVCGSGQTSGAFKSASSVLSECKPLFCISLYGTGDPCTYRENIGELCKLTRGKSVEWSGFFSVESGNHKRFSHEGKLLRDTGVCPGIFRRNE